MRKIILSLVVVIGCVSDKPVAVPHRVVADNPACQGYPPPLCFQGYVFDYTNCRCMKL